MKNQPTLSQTLATSKRYKKQTVTLDQAYEQRNDLKNETWYKLIYTYLDGDTVKIEYSADNDALATTLACEFVQRLKPMLGASGKPILHNGHTMKVIRDTW